MMKDNSLIRLSQSHLNLLEICPPQFQRLYLEQLGSPLSQEQQERLSWGSKFHQLIQQYELGLSIASLVGEDEQLQGSLNALIDAVPIFKNLPQNTWKEAEHCRTVEFQGYLLTVIYDLLIAEPDKAEILDWKTYLQPENPQKLANHWQTRLYLYVLAETTNYLPEQLSMTYWFVKMPTKPQSLTFVYDKDKHQKNHQDLSDLLNKLKNWLNNYSRKSIDFPHLSNCQQSCPYHELLVTQRSKNINSNEDQKDWLSMIEEIQEVSL